MGPPGRLLWLAALSAGPLTLAARRGPSLHPATYGPNMKDDFLQRKRILAFCHPGRLGSRGASIFTLFSDDLAASRFMSWRYVQPLLGIPYARQRSPCIVRTSRSVGRHLEDDSQAPDDS